MSNALWRTSTSILSLKMAFCTYWEHSWTSSFFSKRLHKSGNQKVIWVSHNGVDSEINDVGSGRVSKNSLVCWKKKQQAWASKVTELWTTHCGINVGRFWLCIRILRWLPVRALLPSIQWKLNHGNLSLFHWGQNSHSLASTYLSGKNGHMFLHNTLGVGKLHPFLPPGKLYVHPLMMLTSWTFSHYPTSHGNHPDLATPCKLPFSVDELLRPAVTWKYWLTSRTNSLIVQIQRRNVSHVNPSIISQMFHEKNLRMQKECTVGSLPRMPCPQFEKSHCFVDPLIQSVKSKEPMLD